MSNAYEAELFAMDALDLALHVPEAEQSVIGGLLIAPDRYDAVAEHAGAGDFGIPANRAIFAAIARLIETGQPVDLALVSAELGEALPRVGGLAYLVEMARNTPSVANLVAYAQRVAERAAVRRLHAVGRQIMALAASSELPASEKTDRAESLFGELRGDAATAGATLLGDRLQALVAQLEERVSGTGVQGLSTGFADLDRRIGGLRPGDLWIIGGRPAMGKTTLAMNIAEHCAVRAGARALVFSAEMSSDALLERSLASTGGIPFQQIRTGSVVSSEYAASLTDAASLLRRAPLLVDDRAAPRISEIRARARAAHRREPLSLVVVDYLQLVQGDSRNDNRNLEISEVSRGLKALAKELGCPVIALSQLSRKCEERTDKRPVMADLRESGQIEQDADLITFVYRDEVYHEDSPHKGIAEVITRKHRNGETGTDRLHAQLDRCRFANLAPGYLPPAPAAPRRRSAGMEY